MTEIIRYNLMGKEDLSLGLGTFEVRLADGRVVLLSKIDMGTILSDSTISTQTVTLSTLTLTGGQLVFPATQNASSNANTLDDYEEGTWTPSVGGTATYTIQIGTYTKIGRVVYIHCHLTINAIGTGSTSTISGLPFTSAARTACAIADANSLALSVVSITAWISTSSTSISLGGRTAASVSETVSALLGNSASVSISGFYVV